MTTLTYDEIAKPAKRAKGAVPAKKATKAAPKAKRAPKAAATPARTLRSGTKLELIVGLLKRKEGCTAADILKATLWPAVSVPQQARAAGLKLRTEKDGRALRYWAA